MLYPRLYPVVVAIMISALANAASAQISEPQQVPSRVVVLDETPLRFIVEVVERQSDDLSVDVPTVVSVVRRNGDDEMPGYVVDWEQLQGGLWIQRPLQRVEWTGSEWVPKFGLVSAPVRFIDAPPQPSEAFPVRTVVEATVSIDEYLAGQHPDVLRQQRTERRLERAMETTGGGSVVFDVGTFPLSVVLAARRAEQTLSRLMPAGGPDIIIPVRDAPPELQLPPNVVAETRNDEAALVSHGLAVLFGLELNATLDNEAQEELLYNSFSTPPTYLWSGSVGVTAQSNQVIVPFHLRSVVLDETPPVGSLRPTIFLNTATTALFRFDVNRLNGIEQNRVDLEATLVHEAMHALGLRSEPFTLCAQFNAVTLPDQFAILPGQSTSMSSSTVRRLPSLPMRSFAALLGTEYPMQAGDGEWHWRDDADTGQLVGAMDRTLNPGELRQFTLYSADVRALDVIGYNINFSFFNPPFIPLQGTPVEGETAAPIRPLFTWDSTGTSAYVTIYSTAFGSDDSVVLQSELIGNGTFTPLVDLSAGTQYWWQVTSFGDAGSLESSNLRTFTTATACDSIDFNRNNVFPEDQDVIDFFNVLSGQPCPYPEPCDIDFNNNNVFPEDQDVIDFFNALAGTLC